MIELPNRLYLTFDVEDFINDRSLDALYHVLKFLAQCRQKALFFITGHMAEKLSRFPRIVDLLEEHEIGYHSTSHSVHPNIFEYTDIESYEDAYQTSLSREVAHINPLSGTIEGRGGIETLRDVFSSKRIEAFRAPGFSWSPPHLEAVRQLGIKYDFSTNISKPPIKYRGINFFPFPSFIDSVPLRGLLRSVMKKEVAVLDFHPNFIVNKYWWDSAFFSSRNPEKTSGVSPRTANQVRNMFRKFAKLLRTIQLLKKLKIVDSRGELEESEIELDLTKISITKVYSKITLWPMKQFNYKPRFISSHLSHFFECTHCSTQL